MRKKLILSILIFSFLSNPTIIFAKENILTQSVRSQVQERIRLREQRLENLRRRDREILQYKKASIEAKITDLKKQIVRNFYNRMAERLSATISRLEILISRIESRIAKIESSGTTVSQSVKNNIIQAKQLLSDSKVLLASSNDMLENVLASNQPNEAFKILKENVSEIKDNLVKVHQLLVKVIGDIKGLRIGQNIIPTITVTPVPTQP